MNDVECDCRFSNKKKVHTKSFYRIFFCIFELYVKVTKMHKRIQQKGLRRSETRPTLQLKQLSNEQQTVSFLPPCIHPVFYFLPHPQRSKYTCQLQTTAGSPVINQPALPVHRRTQHTLHTWLRRNRCHTPTQSACSDSQTIVSGRADIRAERDVNPAAILNSGIHTAQTHTELSPRPCLFDVVLLKNQTLAFDG